MNTALRIILTALALAALNLPAMAATDEDLTLISLRRADERALWAAWKYKYALDTGRGALVRDDFHDMVLSEGMAHGLLLAVQFDDRAFFDSLLDGLDAFFLNKNGLYRWKLKPDGSPFEDENTWITATETEINVLFALLQAEALTQAGKWKTGGRHDYGRRAEKLEALILEHESFRLGAVPLLLPSDGRDNPYWPLFYENGPDGPPRVAWNPSYMNPAFFRAFEKRFPGRGWKEISDAGLTLIGRIMDLSPGLLANDAGAKGINPVPAWVWLRAGTNGEGPLIENYFLGSTHEGTRWSNEYDSVRVPLYLGLDFFWNEDTRAKTILGRFVALSGADRPEKAFCGACPDAPRGYSDPLAVGAFGMANMATGNEKEFLAAFRRLLRPDHSAFGGQYADHYYTQTLCLYSLLVLERRFAAIADCGD